jgi:plastocyanin
MGKYLDKIRQHEGTQPIETVKAEEALKQQKALDPSPTIQPGDRITWTRGDLTVQHGVIDFLHTDPDGTGWAFYTLPDGSCGAVNLNHVTTR